MRNRGQRENTGGQIDQATTDPVGRYPQPPGVSACQTDAALNELAALALNKGPPDEVVSAVRPAVQTDAGRAPSRRSRRPSTTPEPGECSVGAARPVQSGRRPGAHLQRG